MSDIGQFWITTLAIVLGPILAVLAAQHIERRRIARDRQLSVFRALMQTRRNRGAYEHVAALNLVEIEFHGKMKILRAFEALMKFFNDGFPRRDGEGDSDYALRKMECHYNLLTELLSEMGKELGYSYNELSILRGGYSPELHGQIETEQAKARRLLSDIYDGERTLPISVWDYRHPQEILDQARNTNGILSAAAEKEQRGEN